MTQSMNLNWHKCQGEVWCNFNAVNLDHNHFNNTEGVYIIWHGGTNPKVVYVGRGTSEKELGNIGKEPISRNILGLLCS